MVVTIDGAGPGCQLLERVRQTQHTPPISPPRGRIRPGPSPCPRARSFGASSDHAIHRQIARDGGQAHSVSEDRLSSSPEELWLILATAFMNNPGELFDTDSTGSDPRTLSKNTRKDDHGTNRLGDVPNDSGTRPG